MSYLHLSTFYARKMKTGGQGFGGDRARRHPGCRGASCSARNATRPTPQSPIAFPSRSSSNHHRYISQRHPHPHPHPHPPPLPCCLRPAISVSNPAFQVASTNTATAHDDTESEREVTPTSHDASARTLRPIPKFPHRQPYYQKSLSARLQTTSVRVLSI